MEKCGIAVIGVGASGLMAAVCLAEELRRRGSRERILLLDAAQKPGKKLLATGNGRCNITNRHISVRKYYGELTDLSKIYIRDEKRMAGRGTAGGFRK